MLVSKSDNVYACPIANEPPSIVSLWLMAIFDGGISLASEDCASICEFVLGLLTASTIKSESVRIRVVVAFMMFLLSLPPLIKAGNKNASCKTREEFLTGLQDYKIHNQLRFRHPTTLHKKSKRCHGLVPWNFTFAAIERQIGSRCHGLAPCSLMILLK